MPSQDLDIHLRMRYVRQAQARLPRLSRNLRQLGATGPVMPQMPANSQHVMVRVNITKASTTPAHVAYLVHAKGYAKTDAQLFGPGTLAQQQFLADARTDPRQFRLVVSPAEKDIPDRTRFIELCMEQLARDVQRPLLWIAAHHFDTAHPHTHIVVRGRDAWGDEWFMAKHYKTYGLQARAQQLLTAFLGPQTQQRETSLQQTRDGISRSSGDPDVLQSPARPAARGLSPSDDMSSSIRQALPQDTRQALLTAMQALRAHRSPQQEPSQARQQGLGM